MKFSVTACWWFSMFFENAFVRRVIRPTPGTSNPARVFGQTPNGLLRKFLRSALSFPLPCCVTSMDPRNPATAMSRTQTTPTGDRREGERDRERDGERDGDD